MSASPIASPGRAIGPVDVTAMTRDEAVSTVLDAIDRGGSALFAFANAHTINLARRDAALRRALAEMTVFNDGIGLELASRMIHGRGFSANLNGTDLTPALLAALRAPTPVFLLGSPPGVAERAAAALSGRYPHCRVVGTHHGFFATDEAAAVTRRIATSGATLVLVGMGQPQQERWAVDHGTSLPATICCIGAFLDFAAGVVSRAPGWVQAARLEWAFRLAAEPRRLARRYLVGNATFMAAMTAVAIRRRIGGRPD
ncbi:WecB/TagA/CpsF family glycosyltransferase [Sphingomonas bacterium]|uniref:WecB/TagA/CpsF family glycosyltransferase n=1 Tax=Sphingomonas bacterium TaxID=1895847 RepID=UPI001575E671|nr:WecB/TagA/CpsF family glycosyltransferase [Sphingomonas bacterium]